MALSNETKFNRFSVGNRCSGCDVRMASDVSPKPVTSIRANRPARRGRSAEAAADYQQRLLGDARLGNALLCRMALSKTHEEILEFVRTIPAESLSCKTMELPEYPSLKLAWFHYHRQRPDGSNLPIDKCKSAALLLNSESLEIVDHVLHDGFSSVSKSSVEPYYVLNRDQPDGTGVKHVILPSGFERTN